MTHWAVAVRAGENAEPVPAYPTVETFSSLAILCTLSIDAGLVGLRADDILVY
jgi:hypothetical protein